MQHPALLLYLRQQHVQQVVHEVEPLEPVAGDARKVCLAWRNFEAPTSFRWDTKPDRDDKPNAGIADREED